MDTDGMTQRQVEAVGVAWGRELLARFAHPGSDFLDTAHARQRALWQRTMGDILMRLSGGELVGVEVKAERRHTGNLFIETWSNRCEDAELRRDGWAFTLRADAILFAFLDAEVVYLMPLPRLKDWCIYDGNAYRYPERTVHATKEGRQRNVTVGHPVPVDALREAVGVREYRRDGAGRWAEVRAESARGN